MKKRVRLYSLILLLCLSVTGCACKHEWQEPNCATPRTCTKCQETEGEPLGHTWADATCETAKTCTVCAETEGEPLGHTAGEWEQISLDPITLVRERVKHCTVCEKLVEEETATLTTLHENGKFLLTCEQIYERLVHIIKELGGEKVIEVYLMEDADGQAVICVFRANNLNTVHAKVYFVGEGEGNIIRYGDTDTCPVWLTCAGSNLDTLGDGTLIFMSMVMDPTLSYDAGSNVIWQAIIGNGVNSHNGIRYTVYGGNNTRYMNIEIE